MLEHAQSSGTPWGRDPREVSGDNSNASKAAPASTPVEERFAVSTDLPEIIAMTAGELDILELHFDEFIRSMLAEA